MEDFSLCLYIKFVLKYHPAQVPTYNAAESHMQMFRSAKTITKVNIKKSINLIVAPYIFVESLLLSTNNCTYITFT